ncbi:MAG: cation diffusion facilitator family transporter [bacterium]|nr:cation diffusion facilitator family transporter [bacterium]
MNSASLTRFAWLAIAGAVVTIALKTAAYFLTGSVGLLSDALESVVNLVAAVIALVALTIAHKPPDEEHSYGHTKAEYFSSIIEGVLIIVAAVVIGYAAVERLINPREIEQVNIGLVIAALASVINFVIARQLLKAGKKYNSITLEADAHHLFTDVWTSVGVIVGVGIVAVTNITMLDPIIAILVALNIVYTGYQLIKRSALGFMDTAIAQEERDKIRMILEKHTGETIQYHGLRTRQSGRRRFVSLHLLVPGQWTIQKGHDLAEAVEKDIRDAISDVNVLIHTEPIDDEKSYEDISIDRKM